MRGAFYYNLKCLVNIMTACMVKLFQEQLDDGKTIKLTRKQFRKGFAALGAQLSDSDEGLIFEALGEL